MGAAARMAAGVGPAPRGTTADPAGCPTRRSPAPDCRRHARGSRRVRPRECPARGTGCHCTERSTVTEVLIDRPELEGLGVYEFGWADSDVAGASARRGISPEVVTDISRRKGEPEWMLKNRLKGLALFERKPMHTWGADLTGI